MSPTPPDSSHPNRVELLFEQFQQQRDVDGDADFEAFVAQHPEHAAALRAQLRAWNAMEQMLSDALKAGGPEALAGPLPSAEAIYGETLARLKGPRGQASRYRLGRELGRGGFGVVFEAEDNELKRRLAIKRLKRQEVEPGQTVPSMDADRMGRFLEEAQVTAQLDHPHIVPIHELGVDTQGRAYFTMRLVEGRSLREVIQSLHAGEQQWTRTRVLGELLKACQAVAFAHSKGVVHRDLKPANIMLGTFGQLYVMDWGLARLGQAPAAGAASAGAPSAGAEGGPAPHADALGPAAPLRTDREQAAAQGASPLLTREGHVVGTPAYMPPEQARGETTEVGPLSDVYALGAILYELLAGFPPYEDLLPDGPDTAAERRIALVVERAPTPLAAAARDAPAELVAICEKAMARTAGERYASVAELQEDLSAYLELRVVKAHARGPLVELRKWVARHRGTAAALLALVLVSMGGLWWHQRSELEAERRISEQERAAKEQERLAAERERELSAEVRARLAESHVTSAELAAQRGAWRDALTSLEAALALGHHDEARLRVAAARAYAALAEPYLAQAELVRAATAHGAEAVKGQRLLVEATLGSLDPTAAARSRELLEQALDAGLPEADEAYVYALLAPTAERARHWLERAIALEPFHHLAWTDLLVTLFWMQRLDAARECAARFTAVFPQDPLPHVFEVLLTGMHDVEAARQQAADLAPLLGAGAVSDLGLALDVFEVALGAMDVDEVLRSNFGQASRFGLEEWGRVVGSVMLRAGGPDREAGDSPLRSLRGRGGLRHLSEFSGHMLRAGLALLAQDLDGLREAMQQALQHNPFLEVSYVHTMLIVATGQGDAATFLRAADAMRAARVADGLLVSFQRASTFLELTCLSQVQADVLDADHRARAQALLLEIASWPDASTFQRVYALEHAIHLGDGVAVDALARRMQAAEPDDLSTARAQLWAHVLNERWTLAIEAADALGPRVPEDGRIRVLRQQAVTALAEALGQSAAPLTTP